MNRLIWQRLFVVWPKESMIRKSMPRQWLGLKNIAKRMRAMTLIYLKKRRPVHKKMRTGSSLWKWQSSCAIWCRETLNWKNSDLRKRLWGIMLLRQVSKGSVSGPISIRMATSLKHYSILRSIGMVFVRLLSLQQKTMLVTVWLCCLVICWRIVHRFFQMYAHIGVRKQWNVWPVKSWQEWLLTVLFTWLIRGQLLLTEPDSRRMLTENLRWNLAGKLQKEKLRSVWRLLPGIRLIAIISVEVVSLPISYQKEVCL